MKTKAGIHLKPLRSVATFAVTISLVVCQLSSVQADEGPKAYTMMVISDAARGKLVTKGKFSDAIERLMMTTMSSDDFEAHNNLCVSYTKTGDLEKAAEACDAAVASRADLTRAAERRLALTKSQIQREQAIALSNRGVLRAIDGDLVGAQDDFMASIRLTKWFPEPKANLTYLETFSESSKLRSRETG